MVELLDLRHTSALEAKGSVILQAMGISQGQTVSCPRALCTIRCKLIAKVMYHPLARQGGYVTELRLLRFTPTGPLVNRKLVWTINRCLGRLFADEPSYVKAGLLETLTAATQDAVHHSTSSFH